MGCVSGILEAWPTILEQERQFLDDPKGERDMEKTRHTEVLNFYNVRLPSDDDNTTKFKQVGPTLCGNVCACMCEDFE